MLNKRKKINLSMSLSVFFLLFFGFCGIVYGASAIRVNEVAPWETTDWIELYVGVSGDYGGYKLYERTTLVKTFPASAWNLTSGDYVLIHSEAGTDETNATGDTNANGYWDIYGAGQFTGTDNVIIVSSDTASAGIIDALCFAKVDGTWVAAQKTAFENAINGGEWTGTVGGSIATQESESADATGGQSAGKSIGRDSSSSDTDNTDVAKDDWSIQTTLTPGSANGGGGGVGGGGEISALITEVAPEVTSGDWVELYMLADGACSGAQIYEYDSSIKTLPAISAKKGEFIVLHFNSSAADETSTTGDTNGNGYWDIYTTDTGLTATDNIISLRSGSGRWIDAMGFSNMDGDMASATGTAYNNMVSTNMWTGGPATFTDGVNDAAVQQSLADWSAYYGKGSSKSLSRKSDINRQPVDSNSNIDWTAGAQSQGEGYGGTPLSTEKLLEIKQSPFSPYKDGIYSESIISYKTDTTSKITMRIYNIKGNVVKTLIQQQDGGQSFVKWDGTDDDGNIVPVGVYIVYLEAVDATTGKVKTGKKTIVVGRKF